MKHYIGLDVSIKRTFICVINEHGKIIREGSENTEPHLIDDYLEKLEVTEMPAKIARAFLFHLRFTNSEKGLGEKKKESR